MHDPLPKVRTHGPITVLVTKELAGRQRPVVGDICGRDGFMPALLDHLQRVACEAAQAHWASSDGSREFMETETGRPGWRAHLHETSAHLIHVVEELQIARFEHA